MVNVKFCEDFVDIDPGIVLLRFAFFRRKGYKKNAL